MDAQAFQPITMALCKATLAAGTTSTISTTSSTSGHLIYAIRSKVYSVADLANTATPTTDYLTGNAFVAIQPGYGNIFLVGLNAAGSVKVIAGVPQQASGSATPPGGWPLDVNNNFINAPPFPQMGGPMPSGGAAPPSSANDFCPIGTITVKIAASNGSAWTFGSSNLSSVTGATIAFADYCGMADRPQVA